MAQRFRFVFEGKAKDEDITFTFFRDGTLTIMDNVSGARLSPRELKGPSYDFYVRKRLAFIRSLLTAEERDSRHVS